MRYFFSGVAGGLAGVTGADDAGAAGVVAGTEAGVEAGEAGGAAGMVAGACTPLTTDPGPFCHAMASAIEPIMKSAASTVVALVNMVAPVRAPNTV